MIPRVGAGRPLLAGILVPLIVRAIDASDWPARMHGALHGAERMR